MTGFEAENGRKSSQFDDRHRREHSLGAPSTRIHQIPILHLPSTSTTQNGQTHKYGQFQRTTSILQNPVAHTFFYEKRQEFLHSSQQMRKMSWEERGEYCRTAWEEKGLELEVINNWG
jgi:hypothetical protein